ncbi:MAG: polysaccharide deacetylase family protein [Candidatus Lokiarchaeota archaeon]|nr:polysaccharide deacetylase family protein [Candidatus Lokiarchaeota archaeon]
MKIALTYDIERDIPNVLDTFFGVKIGLIKILKLLDNYNIKGTFFCTGTVADKQPWAINTIESKGHEIACHSLNHERLNKLSFEECKEIISINKKIIEKKCQKSEIIGFRAPYLKPPKFLFRVLTDLGFKYDSSISTRKKVQYYQTNRFEIQEFHPMDIYTVFRLPLSSFLLRKWILKKELIVLYFHSWEAIDIKSLMCNLNLFKNSSYRIDRWINTGDSFIITLNKFINEAISKKAEFCTLKQFITKKDAQR